MRSTTGSGVLGNVISFFTHISTMGIDATKLAGVNTEIKNAQQNIREANNTLEKNKDLWKQVVNPADDQSSNKSLVFMQTQINSVGEIKLKIDELKKANEDNNIPVEKYLENLKKISELQKQISLPPEKPQQQQTPDQAPSGNPAWLDEKLAEIDMMNSVDEISQQLFDAEMLRQDELSQKKQEIFLQESTDQQTALTEKQVAVMTQIDLENSLTNAKINSAALEKKMRDASTLQELNSLKTEKDVTDKKIELINKEMDARKENTKQYAQNAMDSYNAAESLGKNLNRLAVDFIKTQARKAAASAIASAVEGLPFPFNLLAAAAAGFAAEALFDRLMPSFATGVNNFEGGMALVGERGPEIVNLPHGSDVITATESRRVIAGMSGNSQDGFYIVVAAIENQTSRLEKIERQINLNPDNFNQQYNNFKNGLAYAGAVV